MARITIDITPESVADLLARLPPEQLRLVLDNLSHKVEVREWMRLSEAGFEEQDLPEMVPHRTSSRARGHPMSARIFARTSASTSGDTRSFRVALRLRQSRFLT